MQATHVIIHTSIYDKYADKIITDYLYKFYPNF